MKSQTSGNNYVQLPYAQMLTVVQVFTFENLKTFYINMHPNSLTLLAVCKPEKFNPYQFECTDSQAWKWLNFEKYIDISHTQLSFYL